MAKLIHLSNKSANTSKNSANVFNRLYTARTNKQKQLHTVKSYKQLNKTQLSLHDVSFHSIS